MKEEWQEKRIAALFHDMKREDERRAPSFSHDWHAAMSRLAPKRWPRLVLPTGNAFRVILGATLVALIGVAIILLGTTSERLTTEETTGQNAIVIPMPTPFSIQPSPPSTPAGLEKHRRSLAKVEHRRVRPAGPQPAILISQWRSPTDFLLKTPGDPLLKTIPPLGESLIEIKAIHDEKN